MDLQEMGNLEFVLANEMAGILVKFKNVGFIAAMVALVLGKVLWRIYLLRESIHSNQV